MVDALEIVWRQQDDVTSAVETAERSHDTLSSVTSVAENSHWVAILLACPDNYSSLSGRSGHLEELLREALEVRNMLEVNWIMVFRDVDLWDLHTFRTYNTINCKALAKNAISDQIGLRYLANGA